MFFFCFVSIENMMEMESDKASVECYIVVVIVDQVEIVPFVYCRSSRLYVLTNRQLGDSFHGFIFSFSFFYTLFLSSPPLSLSLSPFLSSKARLCMYCSDIVVDIGKLILTTTNTIFCLLIGVGSRLVNYYCCSFCSFACVCFVSFFFLFFIFFCFHFVSTNFYLKTIERTLNSLNFNFVDLFRIVFCALTQQTEFSFVFLVLFFRTSEFSFSSYHLSLQLVCV